MKNCRSPTKAKKKNNNIRLLLFVVALTTFSWLSQSVPLLRHLPETAGKLELPNITSLISNKWGPGRERELTVGWIISPFLIKWLKKSQHIKGKRAPGSPAFSLDGREVNKTAKPPQPSRAKNQAPKEQRVFKDVTELWQNRAEGEEDNGATARLEPKAAL